MNNFAEIVRVGIIAGLGVVLMIMALLIANGNSFLTKGQIIFALGLILEGIFSKGIFYYLGVGCLFFGAVLMVAVSKKLVKRV